MINLADLVNQSFFLDAHVDTMRLCGGDRLGVSSWVVRLKICFTGWSLFMDTFCGVHQQREGMELAPLCTRVLFVYLLLFFFVSKKIFYESLNIYKITRI